MQDAVLNELGRAIHAARTRHNLTQERLAEAAGISKEYVSTIENGKCNPSYKIVVNLAAALEIPIRSLFSPSTEHKLEDAEVLLAHYQKCPEEYRNLFLHMIAHLANELVATRNDSRTNA